MWTIIIILLIAWLALAVIGFLVEALLWLAFIGIALFAITVAYGFLRQRFRSRT